MKLKCARDDVNVGAPEARRQATEQPQSPPSFALLSPSCHSNCKSSAQVEAERERERERKSLSSLNETIQLTIKVLQHFRMNDEKINCICDSIP